MKNKVIYILPVIVLAVMCLVNFVVAANDDDNKKDSYIIVGGAAVNASGGNTPNPFTAGRAAEYRFNDDVAILGFGTNFISEKGYAFMSAHLYNTDEMGARIKAAMNRSFFIEAGLERFIHRLDNDSLKSWEGGYIDVTNDALEQEMIMRLTILEGNIKYKPSGFPGVSAIFHSRIIGREGDRQARGMSGHCGNCHVNSTTQAFETSQLTAGLGAHYARKNFAAKYDFEYRKFEDSGDPVTFVNVSTRHDWEMAAQGESYTALDLADSTLYNNAVAFRYDLSPKATVSAKVKVGSVENDTTGYTQDLSYARGSANIYATKYLRFKGSYTYYSVSSNVPGEFASNELINGFGFDRTQMMGAAIFRPNKKLTLEGSYLHEEFDREGVHSVETSSKDVFKIKGLYRPNNELRIRASYTFLDREDPLGHVKLDHGVLSEDIFQPYEGTEVNRFDVSVLYMPNSNVNFSMTFFNADEDGSIAISSADTTNTGLDLEKSTRQLNMAANVSLTENFGFYGSFTNFANEFGREYFFGGRESRIPFIARDWYTQVDYEGEGNTFSAGAWWNMGLVSLYPGVHYTTTDAGIKELAFSDELIAATYQEVTIVRASIKAVAPINDSLLATVGYYVDDYQDDNISQANTSVSTIVGYLKYKF